MARVLIVGGGCRGRRLAGELVAAGHALTITTRTDARRAEIEACGAECRVASPDRLATLRAALDGVTIACWLLARASGDAQQVRALHGPRLEAFLRQIIDTTVRGLVYDASPGVGAPELLAAGRRAVESATALHAIPAVVLGGRDARSDEAWLDEARQAVGSLLGDPGGIS